MFSNPSPRAMAQDYWIQVVTNLDERIALMEAAPKPPEPKKLNTRSSNRYQQQRYQLLLDYIFKTRREEVIAHAKKLQSELDAIMNSEPPT